MNQDPLASPDPESKLDVNENPFAAPQAVGEPILLVEGVDEVERVRKEYIKREVSIKSIGTVYYLAGFLLVLYSVTLGYVMMNVVDQFGAVGTVQIISFMIFPMLIGGTGAFVLMTAYGLRRLLPYSRATGILCSFFGLFVLPLGTIVSIYSLYQFLSKKGAYVFEPEYKAVIAATPHVRYKTPMIVWILLTLVVLLVILWVAYGLSS